MAKIYLPQVHEGKTMRLLDRYQFINGVMVVSNEDAKKMAPMLVRFYECTVELDVATETAAENLSDGSLTIESTKGITTSVTNEDLEKELAEFEANKAKLAQEAADKLKLEQEAADKLKLEQEAADKLKLEQEAADKAKLAADAAKTTKK